MTLVSIDEKTWALAQWEIHWHRCLINNIVATLEACAKKRAGPSNALGRSVRDRPPLGIDVALKEVKRLIAEDKARFREAFEMGADEIFRRINEESRG